MRPNYLKATMKTAVLAITILLLGAGLSVAQQQVNLSAGPATATLPDGNVVPMWGYTCGTAVVGSNATCAALNPTASGAWSPVVITVPTGQGLTINLTNSLTFGANSLPTSLVIVGQLGAGLGTAATSTPSPDHTNAQANVTWPIAGPASTPGTPPTQGNRVQSFSTEVAAGATTALTWTSLRPGTYLIESGTHPSIQGPMGLYGMLVVTAAPSGATQGTAYPAVGTTPAVTYSAEVPLLLSEIDPVQNNSVSAAVNTAGFSETMVWSGQPGGCGNPNSATYHQCYPPAVNYTPLYYLFNGVAFNKTATSASLFPTTPGTTATPASGNVLVRFVNAGLRMHVPSIVGSQTGVPVPPATLPPSGFSLVAEDGNPLPGLPRVQSEVFLAPGKTYDVMINVPASGATALPVYDRELSLSANSTGRDAGMLAYISVNGAGLPSAAGLGNAVANPDTYNSVIAGQTLTVSDPAKGVIANDVNVYGVQVVTGPTQGMLTLNQNGTFAYVANAGWTGSDSFVYKANGNASITATVTLGAAPIEAGSGITCTSPTYSSTVATFLSIKPPGILSFCKDAAGYPLTVNAASVTSTGFTTLSVDPNGGVNALVPSANTYTFSFKAQNSQGTVSSTAATVTLVFPPPSNLAVTVLDGKDKTTAISDYRWIIEEDRTFYIDPTKTTNTGGTSSTTVVPTFGTNFHTSYMPVVATGCTGALSCESGQTLLGQSAVCDVGNGVCRTTAAQQTPVLPSQVALDPTKRYYISILPGDAANPFESANAITGHGMGGAPIAFPTNGTAVTIYAQPTPFPPSKLSVFVFEDDFPLNGEQDAGGGVDVLAPNEPGLGGFNITLFDDAGGTGDATGQMTYDMFNMPLSNGLAGTVDPATGKDACPISAKATVGFDGTTSPTGITGTIVTCPKFEADGTTLSPLAGQAVVSNLMPGRYGVVATPGADRIGRGEEWLQTNTLDGQKAHDSFLRIGEPSFFQEFGPAGYHVTIGFANPAIINGRLKGVCNGTDINITGSNCTNTVTGLVTTERMSRTPDERLYSSGSNDSFAFTQCYVSFGDPDGEDFAFTKCNADGTFSMSGLPDGSWRITVFDQWNDMLVDGLSTPVLLGGGKTTNMGDIAMNQWQANISTSTFFDLNGNGVRDDNEPGLTLLPTNIRFRDGSYSNFNNTDLNGNAGFNEEFPLFSWYVVETDITRYKNTGTHVVYDAGGPADGTPGGGSSNIAKFMANTLEPATVALPTALRVPGAFYCANADCTDASVPFTPGGTGGSTGRIDPPWVITEGWQGFSGQNNILEFGKTPYKLGETGGIHGEVIYASTRPFDDPQLLIHTSWTPDVPGVTINLYQEGTAPDGTTSLKLVDTTKTSSFDDWAQGFRSDGVPNMNCPGQTTTDLFFFSLYQQPNWLDVYNHAGTPTHTLPANSQFKCYDGMHNWNQLQPAPYDGMYQFPSVTSMDPVTGKPTGTNCTACVPNPDSSDPYRAGTPMLPAGKYVVEMIVPPGYELVKEEDKNILIGDNYIAPVTQQFAGLGNIFILPDQAEVASLYGSGNPNNPQNPTQNLGRAEGLPSHEGDTGSVETFWPCVGQARVVPDFISLFPQSAEVAPFAGATRNLCDRKEVTLTDQTAALAKFWVFTSAHVAAHFTGVITDDFTSEFDPFSPQFGEKFAPPNLPISLKDWTGTEISRVYTDQWGAYNGLTYSTWEVNPPNPTGYAPTMLVTCMNDPGTGPTPDPLYNPQYSQFCYEIPFMPGQTQYMDTPVVPTSAFAGAGYNNPDCAYPDATPAISEVDGDGVGPWVSAAGHTLTIKSLGDQLVKNNAYSGPAATAPPFNQKSITRHYGFGATAGTVTIGGVNAAVTSGGWSDGQITVTVPSGVPACSMQQQAQYGGSTALCGELVITAANGKQSVDTVTVTIAGKAPTYVSGNTPLLQSGFGSIQQAINAASPGDLIIVPPGVYNEMVLMWKPVRLQGVGAASSVINANTQPAGKLDPWRAAVNCLFGLALNGQPYTGNGQNGGSNSYDGSGNQSCPATGWNYFSGGPNNPQVDRLPLEGILGWDTTVNGNLAQLLQEPTLMGAYEGAGITVLSKGVKIPAGATNIFGSGAESAFPTGSVVLTANDCGGGLLPNPYSSNFQCNPSSIDGLSVTNSSQGGGGIFVHAWGHNLQIANNRVTNNSGTLTGGITIGQGESPDAYLFGATAASDPGSCDTSTHPINTQLPYCFDTNVNVHHNAVMLNSSIGDELFSSTPAGAGGVTFCTGADFYKFNYNWVCGNLSSGDGGGVVHLGFIWNGDIEHNSILFNQSTNPTVPTNGGGLIVMGAPPDGAPIGAAPGVECGSTAADQDCTPGLSDGSGPGLVINANLIMGNSAESGSGGGLRFQNINGTELASFPTTPSRWNSINVTNNIIVNNVAGWDGAGISLEDALSVNIINNTIASNDTTASSGVLFNTLGAPLASSTGTNCTGTSSTTSCPQPAGLVSVDNSPQLTQSLPSTVTCPTGHFTGTTNATNANCRKFSIPLLYNDLFWQNRSFYIGVGSLGSGTLNQQSIVSLFNRDGSAAGNQSFTGDCPSASYWDIGVRGDTGPGSNTMGVKLSPTFSVLTQASEIGLGTNDLIANPDMVSRYCNGSRVPPEFGGSGFQVPPGISDATVPNPVFNLTPAATVDEGNNWINLSWGPLAMTNPLTGLTLGNYALTAASPAINYIPFNASATSAFGLAPNTDFFGNLRKTNNFVDVGAVEFNATPPPSLVSIVPATGARGYSVNVTLNGANLAAVTAVNVSGTGVTVSNVVASGTQVTATFTIARTATLSARTVSVTSPGGNSNPVTFTLVNPPAPTLTSVSPNTGIRGSAVPVTLTGTSLLTTTAVNVSGTGVTVTNINVVSDTQVTALFTISNTATLSARTVTATALGGTSPTAGAPTFTVTGPQLASIAPNAGVRGTSVPVTISGVGLTGATAVTVSGTGVTATGVTPVNDTTVTATLNIAGGTATALGARTITVTTPIGITPTSLFVTFTVQGPTLASIAPNTGARGHSVPVTVTGTSLTGATALTVTGGGITVAAGTFHVVNDTTVTATLNITNAAALGARNVSLTTPIGVTNTVPFTVTAPPAPILSTIAPNTGVRGTVVPVILTGTNLTAVPPTVTVSGTGVTVSGVTVVNDGQINATFTISATATLSARTVSVTTATGETSNTLTFTVQGATLASINPTSGLHNTTVPVTLAGTNLAGATAVTISGTGVTCTGITSTSTTVNANCAISNTALHTARNVTATTPIGATNTLINAFTVQ